MIRVIRLVVLVLTLIYVQGWLISTPKKIAVVGGGAAGYFAAISCANRLRLNKIPGQIVLLEAGRASLTKVSISGGGRCNVLHDPTKPTEEIAKGYPRGREELLQPLSSKFSPLDTYRWFNERGANLKTERDGRVFPSSDQSQTIVGILEKRRCCKLMYDVPVGCELTSETKILECDKVIMATGSAKLGHEIVEKFGHSIIKTVPSLFSFKIADPELTDLAGLSCQWAKAKVMVSNDEDASSCLLSKSDMIQRGPLLITKQGLSGPCILKLSAFAARYLATHQYNCNISVSWVGDIPQDKIVTHLEREKLQHPNRLIGKYFPYLTPDLVARLDSTGSSSRSLVENEGEGESVINRRLWLYLLKRCQIDGNALVWQGLNKQKIHRIAQEVTRSVFKVEGRGMYKDEFVTCGGVSLKEVSMETLESMVAPGVYLAGEVLDIDGITGGYNFQSAWTTGYIAGTSCAES